MRRAEFGARNDDAECKQIYFNYASRGRSTNSVPLENGATEKEWRISAEVLEWVLECVYAGSGLLPLLVPGCNAEW